MNFLCRCNSCGWEQWLKGIDEPETNACEIDGDLGCGHDDFDVIESEYEDPLEDDVI